MFSIQEQCSWIFLSVQGYFSACIGPHISCQKPNSIFHTEATFYTLALDSEGQAHDLWPTFERVGGGWWGGSLVAGPKAACHTPTNAKAKALNFN